MHVKPIRFQNQGCLHFITFSCYRRMKLLCYPAARDTFERELERVRRWYGCFVTGYVVMPEHVHLLISEPERGKLSLVIQMLKQITSLKLRSKAHPPAKNAGRVGQPAGGAGQSKRFWQVRYYDFPVWTEAKRIEKLRYIHRNPVSRGLVERPEDWKWSSFAHHATGAEGAVEIESQWTARRREGLGVVSSLQKPTLPHKPREGWGNRQWKNSERIGQPALPDEIPGPSTGLRAGSAKTAQNGAASVVVVSARSKARANRPLVAISKSPSAKTESAGNFPPSC